LAEGLAGFWRGFASGTRKRNERSCAKKNPLGRREGKKGIKGKEGVPMVKVGTREKTEWEKKMRETERA